MSRAPTRIYLEADLRGENVEMDAKTAHYLSHVLRLEKGAEVVAFDGRGTERRARISSLSRKRPTLMLLEALQPLPEAALQILLIQGLIKPDRMDLIVQKATELGVSKLIATRTEFASVKLDTERADRKLGHWRKIAGRACEQSGRHFGPTLQFSGSLEHALASASAGTAHVALERGGAVSMRDLPAPDKAVALIVGPEGGFSPQEIELLTAAGCPFVGLGQRTLRAETAAIAACAMAQLLWGEF